MDQAHQKGYNITHAIASTKSVIEQYVTGRTLHPATAVTWQDKVISYIGIIADYLFTRSSLENTSALLALLTFLVIAMSWSSRLGGFGRFSPFGRTQQGGSAQVSDADFSYITNDDLRKQEADSAAQSQSGPRRDTDVLVIKNKRNAYSVHFPAYSIERGELTVGQVREQAAKKVGSADARRVKLLYRGRNLKEDGESCRHAGLREGSELMCTFGDALPSESLDDESESEDDGLDGQLGGADDDQPKKKRNRGKKTKKRNRKNPSGSSTPAESALPVPSQGSTRPSSPRPAPVPATPMGKLDALYDKLNTFIPECQSFTMSPPTDLGKRDFEHKRLSETVFMQVMLKLDAVETDGDPDARARRKELVKETQKVLNGLDAAMK